jgi:hypothetical protein
MTLPNPPGHQVVAPGQVIGSAWGNAAWDQSVNRFASAPDRDNQWTAPPNGALCYTLDTGALWIRRAGAWEPMPRGALWIQSWQTIYTVGVNGGVGPINYPGGPFKAGTIPMLFFTNGDVDGGWAQAAVYLPGTDYNHFTFNQYSFTGALVKNTPIRVNVLAIGTAP